MFINRRDAGEKLGEALERYKDCDAVVLAIPRGGVEVGYHVARRLGTPLSMIVSRKLPFPYNPEAGFGAVTEDGSVYIMKEVVSGIPESTIQSIINEQMKEIDRRIEVLRKGKPLPDIQGRTVIVVDDGIAMGATMRASIALCRNKGAEKLIVAAPVSGKDVVSSIRDTVDDAVILETPSFFRAVAQVYRDWYDVPDEEVRQIMEKAREEGL